MNELILIKSCSNGDPKAQKALFDAFYKQMYNLGMRLLANHHDTEDALIAAFSKVFDKINGFEFRGENSLKKWIKTIVINESIRILDQKKALPYTEDYMTAEHETAYDEEIMDIDADEAYTIIENMPVGYRTVFNLYAIEGYSHNEIAEMLNIKQSTSKSQLCKARNYIITKLEKNNPYGNKKYG